VLIKRPLLGVIFVEHEKENKIAAKYYDLMPYKRPEGDLNLFARSGNRRNEVIIGGEDRDWYAYCTGYWKAADALVRYLIQADLPTRRDYSIHWESVAYSILFLYRHYLELRLKQLFITCGGELETVNNEHSLLKLWETFFKQYEAFYKEYNLNSEEPSGDSLKDIDTVAKIIAQFNNIDEKSQIFRYPTDKIGRVILPPMQIDMVRLQEILGWTSQFLDAWSNGIYECWQAGLQSRYESEHP
jgi:hypothetical protein